jgi:membrane protein
MKQVMPVSAYDLVFKTIGEITENSSGGKLTIGIIAALWAASAGIDSIRVALNGVYNLTETRPWWKTKLLSVGLTFGLAILLTIALGVVFYGGKFISLILGTLNFSISSPFFLGFLQVVTVLAVLITIFAIIYNKIPDHTKYKWVWVTPGAIVGIALWLLLSYGFRLYLGYFDSYDKTYGSLGAVIILMLWLYLTALVILVGGTINAVLQEFSDPVTAKAAERKAEAKEVIEDPENQTKDKKSGAEGLPKRASKKESETEKDKKKDSEKD